MHHTQKKSPQVTTLTLINYQTFLSKCWAFGMMQFAHQHLANIPGMRFYKLMGSGKGLGFNPLPDWSVYAVLQIWDSEKDAHIFFENSSLFHQYRQKSHQIITLFLKNITAHGLWSKSNPFDVSDSLEKNLPIAVITRATIKNAQLMRFWRYVPTAEKPIKNAKGLIYTKGIGEMPIKQMATFSIWENLEAVKAYAYQSKAHSEAIKMTKKYNWYSEELFARFQVYKTIGNWTAIQTELDSNRFGNC